MTLHRTFLVTALALVISSNAVAEEVPVIELSNGQANAQPSQGYNAPISQSSELMLVIQQLQDEVRSLRGQIEQQEHRLKRMEQQQLDRYRDLDRRISSLKSSAPVVASAPAVGSTLQSTATNSTVTTPPAPSNQTSQAMVQPDATKSDAKAYKEAFGLVRERNFPKATEAFNLFVKDYPRSPRLANAHYWLGEIYLAEQKPELARESFMQVLTNFADHRKAPDAAYKLGIVYDQLGDKKKSTEYLDLVINKYPDSSAVRLAKEFKRLQ